MLLAGIFHAKWNHKSPEPGKALLLVIQKITPTLLLLVASIARQVRKIGPWLRLSLTAIRCL
jgi:hypothetical protein